MDSMNNIFLMSLTMYAIANCRKGRPHRWLVEAAVAAIYIAAIIGNKGKIFGYIREITSGNSALEIAGAASALITIAAIGFVALEGLYDIAMTYKVMTLWEKIQKDEKANAMIEVISITDDDITKLVKIKNLGSELADEIEACGIKAGKLKELADQLHNEIQVTQYENKKNV